MNRLIKIFYMLFVILLNPINNMNYESSEIFGAIISWIVLDKEVFRYILKRKENIVIKFVGQFTYFSEK